MPMYEFSCKKCGETFEELMSLAEMESAKPECPECGSKKTERQMSAFATAGDGGAVLGGSCGGGGFT
jgi:putative FmdB family regulatory protein